MNCRIAQLAAILGLTALLLSLASAAPASSSEGPGASASAVKKKKFKKLKKRVSRLEARLAALAREPGPRGPQGPAGTAPACRGNGSGDAMVAAGAACIDEYEVSVWSSPAGGTQYGANTDDYPCNDNGQDCTNIYARSVPGVTPSRFITYFQAQQALANVGKRLPTNAEWQQAVAGTPDGAPCVVTAGVQFTGANPGCVSRFGANDMVGNLWEWVGDWDEEASGCASWPAGYGSDLTCLGRDSGDASSHRPGALIRGGAFFDGVIAGPFAVIGSFQPYASDDEVGFRGAR